MTRTILAPALAAAIMLGTALPALAAAPAKGDPALYDAVRAGRAGVARTETKLNEAKAAYLDVPISRAAVSLSLARMSYDTASLLLSMDDQRGEARNWLARGDKYLKEAAMGLVPSRGAEVRGMLIDAGSLPKTEAGVKALVEKLASANFNVLVPEVYRRGYTIYGSRYTERDPEFAKAPDLLRVLIREAHKHGMEVHPWIWTFRAKSPGFGNPLLGRLPALGARTEGKETRFLAAASPQAREYVYRLVEELADTYEIDGLLMDYIRYDEEIQEDDISKTQFALEYQARHGTMPPNPIPKNSPLMVEWQLWREQQVNLAVQEISRLLKARHPRFPVACAVFRGEAYARLVKMQNWRHWSNNDWVDWPSPMLYTGKTQELSTWMDWETDKRTRTNLIYPILGVHRFNSPDNLVQELELLNDENIAGSMIFALAHFDMALLDDLKAGPYREPATLPHRNLVRATRKTLAQTSYYLGRVFAQGDFEAAATAHMLHEELVKVTRNLPLHEGPYYQNDALIERLRSLQGLADVAPWPTATRKEFKHRLDYAVALIRANKFRLERTRYVPPTLPPIKVDESQLKGPQD